MLHGDLMIRPNDGSLEQRPDIFERVSVGKPAHVLFLTMVNRYVDRVVIIKAVIAFVFIRRDYSGFVNEPYDSLSFVPTVFALTGDLQRDNTPDAALGNRGFLKFPGRVISEVAGQKSKPDAGAPVR